ncbi:MAG: hypothetical protein JO361_09330 [Gammaproteobacteria bacterium]|nr:hypothetical protein [Gammaproteobacteria bacterium]
MRTRNYLIGGFCAAVIAAHGASTPGGSDPAVGDDGLTAVPEETLKDMRGGVDLGGLVGYFAIDRVVQVDGQVVAKMQIVVSNLDKLSSGGMPTVTVSGPLAELVQVVNGPAGSAGSSPDGVVLGRARNSSETSRGGAAGSAGGVSGQSFGAAGMGGSGGSGGSFQSTITVTPGGQGAMPTISGSGNEAITKIIPVGNSGNFVVVSNLPNAGGIATAVQNEVRGTMIQTQTTISAQLNSLTLLNAVQLANAMRLQLSLPIGH